jgi:ABC-type branched-subunit amino acid transport system ATPase component
VGGTSVNVTRIVVFCISAYIAAISGALMGMVLTVVTGASYDPLSSLTYFALVLIVAGGIPWYALIGGIGFSVLPVYITNANTGNYLQLLFGLGAITTALGLQAKMPARLHSSLDRLGRSKTRETPVRSSEVPVAPIDRPNGSLEVKELVVQFGGLVAVQGLSLEAKAGSITGLIGPNGSGKTTTLNACSGLVKPRDGNIHLADKIITGLSPARRAHRGLGRTFQAMELYDSLSVLENVKLGREAFQAGTGVLHQLMATPSQKSESISVAREALELCGIADLSSIQVGSLSTGHRRLVELARCLAGPFDILLLDEPSSGLDRSETVHFGEIVRHVVDTRGVGILLVEHDMSLVLEVCNDIFVMDAGSLIFHGTPDEVRRSPEVQSAYLGTEALVGSTATPDPGSGATTSEPRGGTGDHA